MIGWLTSLGDAALDIIGSLLQFFSGVVNGLMNLIKILPQVLSAVSLGIGYIPSTFATFAFISIAIMVIYLIVGRNTGES